VDPLRGRAPGDEEVDVRALRLLLAVGAALLATATAAPALAAPPRASLPDLEDEVMCVLCKVPLNVAEAPEADAERRFISTLIARGESKDQIKKALVAEYGEGVLSAPKATGFGLAAYLVPLLAILAAAGALAVLWPRWRRSAKQRDARPATPQEPITTADSHRLDQELASFD
jgi:cytochrome c-type biogenesis protein CcmH/NrfF